MGGALGDLVQLTFDTFTVGKFVSFTSAGCPDGHMAIRESGRPELGGQWCGSAWGYTVYYSETGSLNLSLRLDKLSQQGIGYNFDFKLSYKFLRRNEARLRYGNKTAATWRGALTAGTYCDRVLSGCSRRPCRLQSPNFPGVYPRNVTCLYKIEHHEPAPPGMHTMIAVRQANSHKVHIKDQIVKYDRSQRVLRVWDQCNVVQDYLTFYDGPTTDSPVLVRLCGGDSVPDIVSSGSDMTLEFHTSPYDNPFHPVPLSYLPGFELEVQIIYADIDSNTYVREQGHCEFLLTTFDSSSGLLENPRHSLPPNTTCTYHFQGRTNEIVWLSFIKYYAASMDSMGYDMNNECSTQIRIWDGRIPNERGPNTNFTLLGEFCKDEAPKLCDHTLLANNSRTTRPCSLSESYVSSGPELTIEHFLKQGSALSPVSFLLRYEFIDISMEGIPNPHSHNPCDRIFKSSINGPTYGRFQAPKSTFFYGRGGAQNISCILRFEAGVGEKIRLTFNRALFGNKSCYTKKDIKTHRWKCEQQKWSKIPGIAELTISEYPWPDINLPRDCICSNMTDMFRITTLISQVVEINFTVTFMNITEDFDDYFFEGEYQFVPKGDFEDEICSSHWNDRRLRGSSGEIALRSPEVPRGSTTTNDLIENNSRITKKCVHQPWLIEPEDALNNFLYLKVRGREIISGQFCTTSNRIIVYSGMDTSVPRIICPLTNGGNEEEISNIVELFSEGWASTTIEEEIQTLLKPHAKSFIVEFLQSEAGSYVVTWIEVSKRPLLTASTSFAMNSPVDCPYRCPELNACISESLWCDSVPHCPSGFDEEESNCSYQFTLPILYVLVGAGVISILALLLALTGCIKYCQHRRREKKKQVAQLNNSQMSSNHLHVNHMHHNHNHNMSHHHGMHSHHNGGRMSMRYPGPSLEDMFLDGKDSLC